MNGMGNNAPLRLLVVSIKGDGKLGGGRGVRCLDLARHQLDVHRLACDTLGTQARLLLPSSDTLLYWRMAWVADVLLAKMMEAVPMERPARS